MKDKSKLETNVCCNVCDCCYNVNGCMCNRDDIQITGEMSNEQSHFCKSFKCKD
ncbi:MAG: DUF1540 domain-containing protein [Clostridia bacterium]|nr:DUF1540 domain-containing protein [Clostridia bacterium]